jgi:dTDP-4-dehydrorhamnose 3,5-epimerase
VNVQPTVLPGVRLIETRVFLDERGHFLEVWREDRYAAAGVEGPFVQDNASFSRRGVLRGLHYQHPCAQGKLVSVAAGEVFDVAVDVRRGSPHFGRWVGFVLSGENGRQLWIPPGFAHGYLTTSEWAVFTYKCTEYYDAGADRSVAWNDPDIGVEWPLGNPLLSPKDAAAPKLADLPRDQLPSA